MDATSPYDKGKNVLEKRDQANEEEDVIGDLMAVMDKHKGKFEKNDRKSGDFMLYGDVDDDDADDTLEMKALMPEDYALDADERNKKGSGSRDAHSPGRNQLDSSEKPMASIENAGKTTTGRSGSVCRLCQGFPKIVIDAEGSRAFVHRVSESIEQELRRLFPQITSFEILVDFEGYSMDGQGKQWELMQVYCVDAAETEEKDLLAVGEHMSCIPAAYRSMHRVLKEAVLPNKADLPLSWKIVNPYAEMVCSGCDGLKTCMESGEAWMKEVEQGNPRLKK